MRNKLVSLDDAASIVRDGDKVMMTSGFTHSPMAMVRAVARAGARNLHTIGLVSGSINLDFLVGTGQTAILECCSISFAPFGRAAPNFDRYLKAGRIFAMDNT